MLIADHIRNAVAKAAGVDTNSVKLDHPEVEEMGDFSTNMAMVLKGGRKLADDIASKIKFDDVIERVEVANPGFINIFLKKEVLITGLENTSGSSKVLDGKKIMVEYAHPNTHKEMHIGHMRTLITGEAIARILDRAGATVFRANYQGDIGPHVAKAIWGTEHLLKERKMTWDEAEVMTSEQKAHLLGEGYVRGNIDYDKFKNEIDNLNKKIYQGDEEIKDKYERTRGWSLLYYDVFYNRFDTKFDKLYFESEMTKKGKEIVIKNTGKVFKESEGAVIFEGEKYGLHTRVFITKDGNPTYEGKDMGLAQAQYSDFPFDTVVHVVANEQTGYFQVIIKALELIDSKFIGREYHLPMGMVNLIGRKISSRTGDVLTVDGLLDEVKTMIPVKTEDRDITESVVMGAVKYSVLKAHPTLNVAFDINQSVNLEGNSGPYLQYTYARTQSVLAKSQALNHNDPYFAKASQGEQINSKLQTQNINPNKEELSILRWVYRFPEVVEEAAKRYSPNLICTYLYELAQRFNSFYNQHSILSADNSDLIVFRLKLTTAVGQVLKNGLGLLGIEALDRM